MVRVYSPPVGKYIIPAPPPREYPSEQHAEEALHAWTRDHSYNLSKQKPKTNTNGEVVARLFECDKAGWPKNTRNIKPQDRKRGARRSKRIGCGMRIKIVAVDESNPTGSWKIVYTRDGSQTHNHSPSVDVRIHAAHRQRGAQVSSNASQQSTASLIEVQTAAGVSTQKVMATMLLTDPSSLVIPKDISNTKSAMRSKLLAQGTSIEVLLAKLKEHNFYHDYEVDQRTNRLLYLMWAHPETTALARHFMDLLLLDYTYKTNRYRLPLLNAVILTGMNTLLPLAQIWLPGEAEPDFNWALAKLRKLLDDNSISSPRVTITDRDLACTNATETIFPESAKVLCRWHIRRNVLAQAQKRFGQTTVQTSDVCRKKSKNSIDTDKFMAKFDDTVNSATESEFMERSTQLVQMSSSMGEYLDRV
jgi:hypothetical protein